MNTVPTLHTNSCTLSAVTQVDIPNLFQILEDSETQRCLPELCNEFPTVESLLQFIASFDTYIIQDEGVLWGIRKDNILIGFIAIMDISTNPTLFYAMHPIYRNKGYMKECLNELIDFVDKENLCYIMNSEVNHENDISRKLLFSIGFYQRKEDYQKMYLIRIGQNIQE